MVDRDRDEWRRPWVAPDPVSAPQDRVVTASEPVGAVSDESSDLPGTTEDQQAGTPTVPLARPRPLAPPSSWDASQEGPGSPAGSVRPPDTTGTVEAPRGRRARGGFVIALVGALIGAVVGTAGTLAAVDRDGGATPSTGGSVTAPVIDVESGDFANVVPAVARAVTPSVVRIDIIGNGGGGAEAQLGLGSGVIYRSDGYIITNEHVTEGSARLRVKLASGEEFPAEIVGTDPLNDLAVLRIDRDGLPAINLRLDEEPVVGETAIAIGSPFGLDASVTAGVISAVGRDITVPDPEPLLIPAVIQTDAAINPGNSGGALVDQQGRLLGINTAILSGTGGSQGVGFAISVGQAVTTADQLIENGEVRHAFLGVRGDNVTPEVAERFGLDEASGALVEEITPGSGAAAAGLRADDIIVAVEDREVDSMSDLVVAIRSFQAGETVTVVYLRDGQRREAEVTLGEIPDQ